MLKELDDLKKELVELRKVYPSGHQKIEKLASAIEGIDSSFTHQDQAMAKAVSLLTSTEADRKSQELELTKANIITELKTHLIYLENELHSGKVFEAEQASIVPTAGENQSSEREANKWPLAKGDALEKELGFTKKDDNSYEYKKGSNHVLASSQGIQFKGEKLSAEGADIMVSAAAKGYEPSPDKVLKIRGKNSEELDLLKKSCEKHKLEDKFKIEYIDLSKPKEKEKAAAPAKEEEEKRTAAPTPTPKR